MGKVRLKPVRPEIHEPCCDPKGCLIPSGETVLTAAVLLENAYLLQSYLKSPNINPNHPNKDGDTPLMLAVKARNLELVTILLADHRLDIDRCGKFNLFPLQVAIAKGDISIVEKLLERGANPYGPLKRESHTVLRQQQEDNAPLALALNDADIMALLLKYCGTVKIGSLIQKALKKSHTNVAKILLSTEQKDKDDFEYYAGDILTTAASYHNCHVYRKLVDFVCQRNEFEHPCSKYDKEMNASKYGSLPYIIHYGCLDCFRYVLPLSGHTVLDQSIAGALIESAVFAWDCGHALDEESTSHFGCKYVPLVSEGFGRFGLSLSPIRLGFVEELLQRGVSIGPLWSRHLYMHFYTGPDITKEAKTMYFLIQVHHSAKDIRLQNLFRNLGFKGDFMSSMLLYLDGYNQNEEDIITIKNKVKTSTFSSHHIVNKDNFDLLKTYPRSLQGLAVLSIRQALAPDVYQRAKALPLPQTLKDLVMLKDTEQLLPHIFL